MSSFKEQLAILFFNLIIFPLSILFIVSYFNPKIGFSKEEGIFALENPDNEMLHQANYWLLLAIAATHVSIFFHSIEKLNSVFVAVFAWLLGLIPGFIAYKKGRNFYNWWMYGHLLFIVAFPHSLLLKETENSLINRGILKKCPYCAEVVKKEAKVCKHCGNQLN
ncbi:zinc ribbon domain-containing protein [Cuspidothrix issatschenkoi LEGE 03284]|uniref:zinc ribbon domain-containing protein n=1 Tax=Cuspidothrix issatschenkoi TaxID=230752 RepID=UPI00187DF80B|nr:zinc ribbon domain-containing protein [Cuspidothrix issatschenkoi]MBE9233897.1 zinc ribbon domain-containing protein [Cuspidothrix issatschenkoi LEGE 03284]